MKKNELQRKVGSHTCENKTKQQNKTTQGICLRIVLTYQNSTEMLPGSTKHHQNPCPPKVRRLCPFSGQGISIISFGRDIYFTNKLKS